MAHQQKSDGNKKIFTILFLILFLDIVGFSLIFPLFPQLADFYLKYDANNAILKGIFNFIHDVLANDNNHYTLVLFGGILGGLYSLLQFMFAPVWGGLSDRYGRKPILLVCMLGLAISYFLWGVSGSFTLLFISRLLGGMMSGNISTATAVVADITGQEDRSKGMAIVGMSFALGFICGPAIGGGLSLIVMTNDFSPAFFGLNPFSTPAFFSMFLALLNFVLLIKYFPETNKNKRAHEHRIINPFLLFRPLDDRNVNLTNFSHFIFLICFSGMEFTLTFLAHQRLGYNAHHNAGMFVYVGLLLALVQGGFVRRKAHKIGEKKLAITGLLFLFPGFYLLGKTTNQTFLYLALSFLSIGAAMIIPCLTALVSLYGPDLKKGQSLGLFRSLGALARVIGPTSAALLYWWLGASVTYGILGVALILPLLLILSLPPQQKI